jgi:dipeptidyl aminopeptidase/acylaminoacyl peptidase
MANRGDWGGGDFRDLMSVLDAVSARPEVDRARLGIGGWSYGAEMTAWAIAHTNRFRAAVAGQGVYDQTAEFLTESDPTGDAWYFGSPWEHPELFARNSPLTFVRDMRTPLLLFHGEADRTNPLGQSQMLYRALKDLGVETRLVTYPGELHLPRRRDHQIDVLERMLEWYQSHLAPP